MVARQSQLPTSAFMSTLRLRRGIKRSLSTASFGRAQALDIRH
jgi:hypothetical protein